MRSALYSIPLFAIAAKAIELGLSCMEALGRGDADGYGDQEDDYNNTLTGIDWYTNGF